LELMAKFQAAQSISRVVSATDAIGVVVTAANAL